jgi:hypothetical protein
MLGLDRPAEHRGQIFPTVVGGTWLSGLQVAQPLDLLAGDKLQRAVADRLRVIVGVRLA